MHTLRSTHAIASLASLSLPLHASAYAMEPVVIRPPVASVHVVGTASMDDAYAVAHCEAHSLLWRGARCHIEAHYELRTRSNVTIDASATTDVVRINGAAIRSAQVEAGRSVTVTVSARRDLEVRRRWSEGPWVLPPMVARHPFLGETRGIELREDHGAVVLVSGEGVTVAGALALEADGDGEVQIDGGASDVILREGDGRPGVSTSDEPATSERRVSIGLSLRAPRPAEGPLRNGGAVLAMGWRGAMSDDAGRFLLRGAWEVSLYEYAFISASCETDFDSVMESLVVDVASPLLLVIVPSVRLGAGVVARQLGPRPADFALRLRAGANLFPAGADIDFDYWPDAASWTVSITSRLSP